MYSNGIGSSYLAFEYSELFSVQGVIRWGNMICTTRCHILEQFHVEKTARNIMHAIVENNYNCILEYSNNHENPMSNNQEQRNFQNETARHLDFHSSL